MADRADLLQGTLDLLILKSLALGPLHGWGVSKRLRQLSREVLEIGQGSLYPALYRLEEKGWITASWETSDKGKRARYYRITPLGRKQLANERSKWDVFARAMRLLIEPGEASE